MIGIVFRDQDFPILRGRDFDSSNHIAVDPASGDHCSSSTERIFTSPLSSSSKEGAGFLFPYNSFIMAMDYFKIRYPGTPVVFDMSLVYIVAVNIYSDNHSCQI
ncbi:hypothetical protein QE152_g40248 [Popillia japonica]|uniref:Uncharacterized protein n=1 Tax=Popillia japonica TaxID=7064 RepID=A0AAW1HRW9_POPJA